MSGAPGPAASPPIAAQAPGGLLWRLRTLPRRVANYAWDNPSAEHDARTILSSPKVGLWLGIEVLVILIACGLSTTVLPDMESEFQGVQVSVGSGRYLIATTLIVLTAFLTLIVPLRASGLLEGPRWRGYMDQIVTTGVSPMRYYAGKWATSQPFFLALLGASIPFVVLFALLGGVSFVRTAVSYVILYGYCNLLLVVAFGLGVVLHEVAALLVTWVSFSGFVILEFTPTPSSLAAMTPIRFLIQPFVEILAGSDAAVAGPLYGAALPFGFEVPWPLWALILWSGLTCIVGLTCVLGPLHAYVPGMNNFGAVVLPGDGRRVFFRRLRPFLTRRVDLSFLFENRGPRLVRWTLPLRSLQQFALLSLIAFLLTTCLFHPTVVKEMNRQGLVVLHAMNTALVLVIGVFVFSSGRTDALGRFKLGRFAIPQIVFDIGAFTCFLATLIALHNVGFAAAWTALTQSRTSFWANMSPAECFQMASGNLSVFCTVAISTFLFTKVSGSKVLSRGGVFFAAVIYLFALFLLPLIALGASSALRQADNDALNRLAVPFFVVAEISPGLQFALVGDGPPRWLKSTHWLVERGFWIWHTLWIAFLALNVFVSHRSLAREAAVLAGEASGIRAGSGDEPPPACAGCRSRRCVPAGLTLWGGALAAKVFGTVRCVDCRAEYSPKTGHPDHRARFLTLAARCGFLLVGSWLLFMALVQVLA